MDGFCEACGHTICRCPLAAGCPGCETEYVTSWAEWAACPRCRHSCCPVMLPDEDQRLLEQSPATLH